MNFVNRFEPWFFRNLSKYWKIHLYGMKEKNKENYLDKLQVRGRYSCLSMLWGRISSGEESWYSSPHPFFNLDFLLQIFRAPLSSSPIDILPNVIYSFPFTFSRYIEPWFSCSQLDIPPNRLEKMDTPLNKLQLYTPLRQVLHKSDHYLAVEKDFDIIINCQGEPDRYVVVVYILDRNLYIK